MNFNQTNNNAGDVINGDNDTHGVVLTEEETAVLCRLTAAFNAYFDLPDRDSCDDFEVADGVHRFQNVIALRVARRANPDVWKTPDGGSKQLNEELNRCRP